MRSETLTAYVLSFRYMERNNPHYEEQKDNIHAGETPKYSFQQFIADYIDSTSKMAVGENSDRGIILSGDNTHSIDLSEGVKRWHLVPRAGKQGKPLTVYKPSLSKKYNFNSDSAALYDHHVYIYDCHSFIIAIFHRENGSGCKSVFMETANNMLKTKGYVMNMDLYVPNQQMQINFCPSKITLQVVQGKKTSDIADNLKRRKKKTIIRELGLNLEASENSSIRDIVRSLQLGKIEKDEAFALIKTESNGSEEYNDAEIQVRIGGRRKTVRWNEIDSAIGSYDITVSVNSSENRKRPFVEVLSEESDKYYRMIKSEMEVAIE